MELLQTFYFMFIIFEYKVFCTDHDIHSEIQEIRNLFSKEMLRLETEMHNRYDRAANEIKFLKEQMKDCKCNKQTNGTESNRE